MSGRSLNDKLSGGLRALSSWDFTVAVGLIFLVTVSSVLYAVYELGYINGKETGDLHSQASISHADFPQFLNSLHVVIATTLVVGAVGLWSRRVGGFFLCAFALLWVQIVYVWWYFNSLAFLRNSEVSSFSELPEIQHVLGLQGAAWWDLVVLVVTITLLLWQAKTLIATIRLPRIKRGV